MATRKKKSLPKIPKHPNARALFEYSEPDAEKFWEKFSELRAACHRDLQDLQKIESLIETVYQKIPQDSSPEIPYSINPSQTNSYLSGLTPVDFMSSPKGFFKGRRITGVMFYFPKAWGLFDPRYKNYLADVPFGKTALLQRAEQDLISSDFVLTIGPTIKEERIVEGLIELLEKPHIYDRGECVYMRYVACPSPKYLAKHYPKIYTAQERKSIKPAN